MLEDAIFLMTYLIKYVFQSKTEDVDLSVFSMIESKMLTKHIKYKVECKLNGKKCYSEQ